MAIMIDVRTESRFAKAATAYNSQIKHGYNPNYINPKTYRIIVTSGLLPSGARSWECRVTRRGGKTLSKSETIPSGAVNPRAKVGFNVPSEGVYDCQLIVTLRGGRKEASGVQSIDLRDLLVVVIGDSAASGQGNPDKAGKLNVSSGGPIDAIEDFISQVAVEQLTSLIVGGKIDPPKLDRPPKWLEKNAHRSLLSGHVQAARSLENLKAGTVVTLLNFARSGAEVMHGLLGPRRDEVRGKNEGSWINKNGKIGQIEEMKTTVGKRRIDALILSIGGNDLGFADGVEAMVTGDSKWIIFNEDDAKARAKIKEHIKKMLGDDLKSGDLTRPGGHFDRLKAEIDKLNVGQVFLVGFPTGFFDDNRKDATGAFVLRSCEVLESVADLDLSEADMRLFRDTAERLNQALNTVIAKRFGWDFVDVTAGFKGHGYCSRGGRFFVHAEESLENQGDIDGMLHPNAAGHAIYTERIHKALQRRLILQGPFANASEKVQTQTSQQVGGSIS